MKKILIVRYEGSPFAIRMSKVIITLLECGFEIDILIPFEKKGGQTYCHSTGMSLDKLVNIYFFRENRYLNFFDKTNLSHGYDFEYQLKSLLKRKKYSAILVKDSHKLSSIFRIIEKNKIEKTPVICDMYENAVEQHRDYYYKFASLPRKITTVLMLNLLRLKINEQKYLLKCNKIFVVVEEMKSYLLDKYTLKSENILVVENVELIEQFDNISCEEINVDIDRNVRIISYVGSIGPHRGIEVFLSSIKLLDGYYKENVIFVIIGATEYQERYLLKMADVLNIRKKIIIKKKICHNDAIRWIKRSEIGIIPHLDTNFIRTTIPNKLFQYMSSSVPVISSDVGPLGRIIRDNDCGYIFTPNSYFELAEKIIFSLKNKNESLLKGINGRRAVEVYYNWRKRSIAYIDFFKNLV